MQYSIDIDCDNIDQRTPITICNGKYTYSSLIAIQKQLGLNWENECLKLENSWKINFRNWKKIILLYKFTPSINIGGYTGEEHGAVWPPPNPRKFYLNFIFEFFFYSKFCEFFSCLFKIFKKFSPSLNLFLDHSPLALMWVNFFFFFSIGIYIKRNISRRFEFSVAVNYLIKC